MALRNGASPTQRGDAAWTRKSDAFGKRTSSSRSSHPNQYAVSDGRTPLAIAETVTGFTAVTTDGVIIGKFSTLRAAASFGEARR